MERVLILAPTGRDALLISDALLRVPLASEICSDIEQFALRLQSDAVAGVVVEEALHGGGDSVLLKALREQPAWSDVPLIVMTSRRGSEPAVAKLLELDGNITLLERPVRK